MSSTEAYYAAQTAAQEGVITEVQWQTYQTLFHNSPGSLNSKAVNQAAAGYFGERGRAPWAAQLKNLEKMGLACNTGKDDWVVSDATTVTPLPPPPKKPSAKKFAKGVGDLEMALIRANSVGLHTPEAEAVLEWLKAKVR